MNPIHSSGLSPLPLPMPTELAGPSGATDFASRLDGKVKQDAIDEAAQLGKEFESLFISLMLKEMRNSFESSEGGLFGSGDSSDTFGGMFDMFMGQHLSEASPLGIADAVERFTRQQLNMDVKPIQSKTDVTG